MRACDGLVVLTLGSGPPVDLAAMVLADNGARVVKIERPGGDPLRTALPSGFLVWNRGKESVELDIRTEAGAERVRELARAADVVLSALGAGVAERYGLGAKDLLSGNPALVHATVSGFGAGSPYAHLKAYDGVVAAKSGAFGAGLQEPFREGPVFTGMARPSIGAAHHVIQGVLAALVARLRTGRGQSLEVSLFDGLSPYDYFGVAAFQLLQRRARGDAGEGKPRVPGGLLCTKDDRWLLPTNRLRKEYEALIRAVGLADLLADPRFALHGGPGAAPTIRDEGDARALWDLISVRVRERTLAEWQPLFDAEDDLAIEWARTCEQVLDHPQMLHNGAVVTVADPHLGPVRQVGAIGTFSVTPSEIVRSAPALGANALEADPPAPVGERAAQADVFGAAPLTGLTIVEVGHHYAMPYAITMLAELGARVIKIEPPAGDHMRDLIPLPEAGGHKVMAGKESVTADLYRPEGREIVYRLVERADVFALGLRAPAAAAMGMDEDSIRARNPDVVYFHGAGYGASGPFAGKAMHAGTAGAAAGALFRQGGRWLAPETAAGRTVDELEEIALRLGNGSAGDAAAAASAASALMLAVFAQRQHGVAQAVTTSMITGNALSFSDDAVTYRGKPPVALPDPEQYGLHALYRLYRAKSGWLFLAVPSEAEWRRLCDAVGRPELTTDPRFRDAAARTAHDGALAETLGELFLAHPAAVWEERLSARGLGCAEAFEGGLSAFVCTDPGLRAAARVVEVPEPVFGPMLRLAPAVSFTETPTQVRPGCWAGQHTGEVLAEIGYSAEEIRRLDALGVTTSTRA